MAEGHLTAHLIFYSLTIFEHVHRMERARRGVGLRHCATNRQVAGSVPGGVIGIFQ